MPAGDTLRSLAGGFLQEASPGYYNLDPLQFAVRASRGRFKTAKHLEYINEVLKKVAEGKITRVMISVPPRHGKSFFVSQFFPAWYLGNYPDNRMILTTYESSFARSWGRKVRNIINEHGANSDLFPHPVRLAQDSRAADAWDIEGHVGGMITAGVGGAITGRGGNCFPYEIQIITEAGAVAIGDLVSMSSQPRVLSYNHALSRVEWSRIVASRVIRDDRLIEIETVCGNKIRTTREHRIFVYKRGYKEACSILPGDRIVTVPFPVKQDMRLLRKNNPEKQPGKTVSGLLSKIAQSPSYYKMFLVWKRSRKASVRISKIFAERTYRFLLQSRMFPGASRGKKRQKMRMVWYINARETAQQILLGWLHSRCSDRTSKTYYVSRMWKRVYCSISIIGSLFARMCQCSAFKTDDRHGESTFQRWRKPFQMVRSDEATYFRSGRLPMRGLWNTGRIIHRQERCISRKFINSSYKRRGLGESSREFNHHLQNMSYDPPQISHDTVAVVREICSGDIPVYDIQVERNRNFFAEKILVHNCIIIDDPIKNSEEAQSVTIQEKLWDWWDSTLSTRLEPDGSIFIIQTRWSKHDLVGKLIDQDDENEWVKIVLPAIAEDNDLLGRLPGEPLWPDRWPIEALLKTRSRMRPFWWNALYQQNPIDKEGTLFKREWFEIVDDYPKGCSQVRYWDFAGTKKKKSDWSAGALIGIKDSLTYIIHIDRFQKTLMDKLPRVIQNAEIDGRGVPVCWEEEGGSSGKDVSEIYAKELMGWTVYPIRSTGPKVVRADPLASQARLGHVRLVRGDWNRAFLDEIETFPFGEHDDQVDSAAGGFNFLTLNSQDVGCITKNPRAEKYGRELPSDPFARHRSKYR